MTKRLIPKFSEFIKQLTSTVFEPQIEDADEFRSLRFNQGVVQSSMCIARPFDLNLSYTRAMMGFLLFNQAPEHILLVGLGGGSLSKYCYRQFPRAQILTLEINPQVIALRDDFLIPADDDRFQILAVDAVEYLARPDVKTDVILLDGYDITGLPASLCTESFYADCQRSLSEQGVLVANLWGGEPRRGLYLKRLSAMFEGRVWWTQPAESSNLIVYAVKNRRYYPQWSQMLETANSLDETHGLGLAQAVQQMRARSPVDIAWF